MATRTRSFAVHQKISCNPPRNPRRQSSKLFFRSMFALFDRFVTLYITWRARLSRAAWVST